VVHSWCCDYAGDLAGYTNSKDDVEREQIMKVLVKNVTSHSSGREVANQFIITTDKGIYFQSYRRVIAFRPYEGGRKIQLDKDSWDYSRTTGKYRNQFLGETKKETEHKVKSGEYELVDLN